MLTKVNSLAGSASTSSLAGSIMMHHSRDTAHKQWAETQVLILTGVARYVYTPLSVCLSVWPVSISVCHTFVCIVYITNFICCYACLKHISMLGYFSRGRMPSAHWIVSTKYGLPFWTTSKFVLVTVLKR